MDAGSPFSRALLASIFVLAGAAHLRSPEVFERTMPPYLPLHRELIYVSGACEILGGLGLFSKRTRPSAGMGLIVLLIAVWPVNVQMLIDARRREVTAVDGAPVGTPAGAVPAHGLGLADLPTLHLSAAARYLGDLTLVFPAPS